MAGEQQDKHRRNLFGLIAVYISTGVHDTGRLLGFLIKPKYWKQVLLGQWQFIRGFFRRFGSEGIFKEASALTYITILGFVPFLLFIVMMAPDLPFFNVKGKLTGAIQTHFMPQSASAVQEILEGMLKRRAGFNIFGFILLLVSSYWLFIGIRNTFDRIMGLKLKTKQGFLSHLAKFLGTVILGMLIMVVMFSSTSLPLVSRLLSFPELQWMTYVIPFLVQFVGLVFLYMLMPSIKIRRSSLIRGAFWTTVVWVLVKSGFDIYITNLTNLRAMYGVLAVIPILLMWIFVNWVIILSGTVVVSMIEHKGSHLDSADESGKMVRITLEMFSNAKLNKRLEGVLKRGDLKELGAVIEEAAEE